MQVKLYEHQQKALEATKERNKVAYYLDMGLGKTFVGSEKLKQLDNRINLLICQKSKIDDWVDHFVEYYELQENLMIYDLTKWGKADWDAFKKDVDFKNDEHNAQKYVLVINYDLAWRRPDLLKLKDIALMLDESSMIQNRKTKRTKFILKLDAKDVILLSGTPCSGKYENLWTQAHLLGWDIKESLYNKQYVNWNTLNIGGMKIKTVDKLKPYKNIERLKRKFVEHGAVFMKTEECYNLPEQNIIDVKTEMCKAYNVFKKHSIVILGDKEIVGDTTLTKMLYLRMLASQYNEHKLNAFKDLITSSRERFIVFYNFDDELDKMLDVVESLERPVSIVNGKTKDLTAYENEDDSITFVQYQAGAKGLNLQKARRLIYFSPTQKCEDYMQSMKRIHRIGQDKACYYYRLIAKNTIDEEVYKALESGEDYTNRLFERGCD